MRVGLQVPDFNWPGGPATLGADLATVARTADDAGFEFISVMDHFFQKSCYFIFDTGRSGEKANEIVDQLGGLAEIGFDTAIGAVANVWDVTPLEIIGSQVIPAVAGL